MSKRKADLTSVGAILVGAALGGLITLGIGQAREASLYADVQVFGDVDNEVECNVDVTAAPSVAWSFSGEAVVFSLNGNRLISNPRRVLVRRNVDRDDVERGSAEYRGETVTLSPDGHFVVRDFDGDGFEDVFISTDHDQVHCVVIEEIAERAAAEAKEAIARQFEEIDMLRFEDMARQLELAARRVAEQRDRLVFRREGFEHGELDRAVRELELKALQLHEIEGELEARLEAQLTELQEALETEVERRKKRRRRPHEGG